MKEAKGKLRQQEAAMRHMKEAMGKLRQQVGSSGGSNVPLASLMSGTKKKNG
jgi:hypothetical protein